MRQFIEPCFKRHGLFLSGGALDIFYVIDGEKKVIHSLVGEAQEGDTAAREKLIAGHLGFIKKIVSKKTVGNEDIESRDEYSIGLMAFNEAVDSYKPGLRSFQSFAADVIKKRIIDYHRSRFSHHDRNIYPLDDSMPVPESANPVEHVHVRLEMECFVQSLSRYNVSLRDLVDETPRHADSRLLCVRIAKIIIGDPGLCQHFKKYRTVPLKMLLQKININRKTVERHRRYIIAICLVMLSELDTLKEYVEYFYKGGESDAGQGNGN